MPQDVVADGPRRREGRGEEALAQVFVARPRDGHSSTTFWWRRWMLHSRSPTAARRPWRVADDLDLDVAGPLDELLGVDGPVSEGGQGLGRDPRKAAASSASASTRRIPLPPPPADAFSRIG